MAEIYALIGSIFVGLSVWQVTIAFRLDEPRERIFAALFAATGTFLLWLSR